MTSLDDICSLELHPKLRITYVLNEVHSLEKNEFPINK